ncbi:MFS transporter [Lacisediminihabitans profunda]|uniref:MFS transporter n=1 Tax=Lacisediminihabitans profunda TaxID=2594790 RepID=A0A5C8UQV5_9MICO|nr:MFS transporter [Lacisediminihabitans profunda]TXN30579.1 MFS transporter [Lacisediminihabitans profunda]
MPLALIALAAGGFGIGLTEFVIAGLLPEVAAEFSVSAASAGWLISGYALSVAVGALVFTAIATRFSRKKVLIVLMVIFIAGNVLSAVAPSFNMLLAGRIIAALSHGAFFGIGSMVAASLVEQSKKAGAVALMFTGLTAANVLGVPLGTLVGEQFGWRTTFWLISLIGVIALVGIVALVPTNHDGDAPGLLRHDLRAFRSGQVWMSLTITLLGFGGMFGAFSYIAFTLTKVSGYPAGAVPLLLVVFGVGLAAGNHFGGKLANKSVDRTLVWALAGLIVVMVFFALTAANPVVTVASLVLMGAFGFGSVPAFQTRVIHFAGEAGTLASGANIAAANVGNAVGAWIGGLAITAGLGFTSPLWTGAGVTLLALVTTLSAAGAVRHRSRVNAVGPAGEAGAVQQSTASSRL